jgi:hypothetical protein
MKQYQYNTIFKKICIPEILKEAENTSIVWHGKELRWDVKHELLAYAEYDNTYNVNELLEVSNNRYKLLDKIWEKKDSIEDFYIKSKKVLPWGHGVFLANHELAEREKSFKDNTIAVNAEGKLVVASVCSLLGASLAAIFHTVRILLINIIKAFPSFLRDEGGMVLYMSEYTSWNIVVGLLHVLQVTDSGAAYVLATDTLAAFCSENQNFIGEPPEIDFKMESLEERKKRQAEETGAKKEKETGKI